MNVLQEKYEPHTVAARACLTTDPELRRLLDPAIEPAVLERFLIEWMARAAYMTEPVDRWIRRTGERCVEQGMERLGKALMTHAKSEAGHHLMTMDDARALVAHWNARRAPALEVEALLGQAPLPSMEAYRALHEETIEGPYPVGQVSIEREVGYLAVEFGPRLMAQVRGVLGDEVARRLSFLEEHVAVDVGHTKLNDRMLAEAITRSPEQAGDYAAAGAGALKAYIRFLGDCLRIAEEQAGTQRAVA